MKTLFFGSYTTFIKIESIELTCFVLEDYTRIISKNSFEKIVGIDPKIETGLFNFFRILSQTIHIPELFLEKLQNPILFEVAFEAEQSKKMLGYESSFLVEMCQVLIAQKKMGNPPKNFSKFIKTAQKINQFFENKRINNLIDEATGFIFFKEKAKNNLSNYFLKINNDLAFEWVITFADTFYEGIFRFMNSSWFEMKQNPSKIADFLYSSIFLRIDDKILIDLKNSKPKRAYVNQNGILLNREHPKLQLYNQGLLDFLEISNFERSEFMQLIIKNYPKITSRENLVFEEIQPENLTVFNEKLKIGLSITK